MRKSLIAAIVLLPTAALAQNEVIVVTATRTPQPAARTGSSISVITGEDIQAQQINVLSDALGQVPGLTVVRTGGLGQPTTIGVRGAPAGQTLVLIDGIRLGDPSATDGGAIIADLMANNIDRVEVLRGPQSTLYGSSALGGVVNILSRLGGPAPFSLTAEAQGGSFGFYRLNAAARGTVDAVDYGVAANFSGSNEVSAADVRNGNREDDGAHNAGVTGNVRWNLSDLLSLDARGYYVRTRTSFDGFPPPTFFTFADTHDHGSNELLAGYAGANLSLFDGRFLNRLAVVASSSDRRSFDPTSVPVETFFGLGGMTRFEYQGVVAIDPDNELTFGAESQLTTVSTHGVFDATPLTQGRNIDNSVYAQIQSTWFDRLTLTGGVRHDDDSQFGGHTSVKVAGAYQLKEWGTVLRANYGDGFKAPSLYQLFSDFSNPFTSLRPETAEGWEAGLDQTLLDGRVRGSLTYFDRRSKNLIDFGFCSAPAECAIRPFGFYINVNRTRATGLEAELSFDLTDTLSGKVNYTNLTAKDLTTGAALPRRPHVQANAEVSWQALVDLNVGASLTYVGPRNSDNFSVQRLAANTTVNVFGSYAIDENWEVFGRVENLFNERTQPVLDYGRPGIGGFAGLRFRT
jgi:vitamin B12 transporter